mmetsp:Transcript_714/g.1574  ORF Transcript_714/g.1574 Transcript_714/m.1574 type:complete len:278 (-) Transcript_714:641-1474(-)
MGGMYRYSMPVMKMPGDVLRRSRSVSRRSTSSQSSTVVHSGFSQRMCFPEAMAFLRVWMCWKFGVQMMSTSTKSQLTRSSSVWKMATRGALGPSSSRASFRATSLVSATAVTCNSFSNRAMFRMCSFPIAPVPMIPARRRWSHKAGPRKAASTRRGGSKLCRLWSTLVLSTMRMSPFFHAKATSFSSINRATAFSAFLSTGVKSPSTTAFSPTFLASFHPVKAATMELKKTWRPVRSSTRSAGRTEVVVRQSPLGSHSQLVPCFRIASSASSRVVTA